MSVKDSMTMLSNKYYIHNFMILQVVIFFAGVYMSKNYGPILMQFSGEVGNDLGNNKYNSF